MRVYFGRTAYYSAFSKDQSEDNKLINKYKSTIEKYAKSRLQFKYGDVSFRKFSAEYRTSGDWFARKIVALPAMLWSGIALTIFDIAKAILIGIPKAFFGNKNYIKVQVFHVIRDLQVSCGWWFTIFNDKFGSYHVQESLFHKNCYNCFIGSKKKFDVFETNNLQTAIQSGLLNRSNLRKLSEEQLRSLKLSDLPKSAIEDIFSSYLESNQKKKEKFKLFSPKDVKLAIEKKLLSREVIKLLSDEQLKELRLSTLSKQMISDLFYWLNGEDNARRFSNFTPEDVQEAILSGLLDCDQYKLLSVKHLEKLEISKLSKATINELFNYSDKKRFAKISAAEVKKAYSMGLLNDRLHLISDEQKKEIGPEFFKPKPQQKSDFFSNDDNLNSEKSYYATLKEFEKLFKSCGLNFDFASQNSKFSGNSGSSSSQSKFSGNFGSGPSQSNFFGNSNFFKNFDSGSSQNKSNEVLKKREEYLIDLGLNSNTSKDEISTAYKKLALKYHPDRNKARFTNESDEQFEKRQKEAEEKFKVINEAYHELIK